LLWTEDEFVSEKKRTVTLGIVFLVCLSLAHVENISFFHYVKNVFSNPPLAILLVFIHNILAVSLILVGMVFYVDFVLVFLPKRKYEYLLLQHLRLFALVFTVMILLVSISGRARSLRAKLSARAHFAFGHSS